MQEKGLEALNKLEFCQLEYFLYLASISKGINIIGNKKNLSKATKLQYLHYYLGVTLQTISNLSVVN